MFIPCFHEGPCKQINNCICAKNNRSCEKYCGCRNNCKFAFPGCDCQPLDCLKKCLCIQYYRECDPDICVNCNCDFDLNNLENNNLNNQQKYCLNTQVLYNKFLDKYEIKRSNLCDGLGLYTTKEINVNEYIGEYIGVYLTSEQDYYSRSTVYSSVMQKYFLFAIADINIDATYFGNYTRYINHNISEACNLNLKILFSQGIWRLIFVAKKAITQNQELYFDYGKQFDVDWKKMFEKFMNQFIKKYVKKNNNLFSQQNQIIK